MKKGSSLLAATFAGLMTLCATGPAFAASSAKINAPKSFQAQFTLQVGGNPPQHGVMFFSHGRIREELIPDGGGPRTVTIIDPMNKTIYQIEDQKKAFRLEPWDPRSALISEALKRSGKRRFVQTQTIGGQECDNFEIDSSEPTVKPFFVFVNRSTRFPVELTTQDPDPSKQIHIEWNKLSPGYQAAILFAPPLGYAELK